MNDVGGKDYLVEMARAEPKAFLTLLGKLVPTQVRAELEGNAIPTVIIRDYTGVEWEEEAKKRTEMRGA